MTTKKMTLAAVQSTRREAPISVLIYGPGGVGKSTFAACAPKPLFLSAEDGLLNIDAKAVKVESWQDALDALDALLEEKHDFETVAIDSLDHLEPLLWDFVCALHKKKSIETFDYAKGYNFAVDHWRTMIRRLELLRASRAMNVVAIAHAMLTTVKNPEGDDFDTYNIKLQDSKKITAAGLFKEKFDNVGFASLETSTAEFSGRVKGLSTGRRILRFQPSAAFFAKTRFQLPRVLPLEWAAFERAVREGGPAAIMRLRGELEERVKTLADVEVESKVRAYLNEKGESVPSLTEAIERLDITIDARRKAS